MPRTSVYSPPNIVPKRTVFSESRENGFINQLEGENYLAVRYDPDGDAYFDTLEEARRYIDMENWVDIVANVLGYEKKTEKEKIFADYYVSPTETAKSEIEVKLFKGYRWKWKTDPEKPSYWHVTFIIQFVIKETNVVISAAKNNCLYCKGSPEDEKNTALKELTKEYKEQISKDTRYGSSILVKPFQEGEQIEIPNLCFCKDSRGKHGLMWAWDEQRTPHENPCSCGFSLKVKPEWIEQIANDPDDVAEPMDEEDAERIKSNKRFNEWIAKTVEFSKEAFFAKTREVASKYEITEVPSKKDNALRFEGKTVELSTYDYSEGLGEKAKRVYYRCKYVLEAVYEENMCHVGTAIDGPHETHMGSGCQLKTAEDLADMEDLIQAHYIEKRQKKGKQAGQPTERYQQMSIFDFLN